MIVNDFVFVWLCLYLLLNHASVQCNHRMQIKLAILESAINFTGNTRQQVVSEISLNVLSNASHAAESMTYRYSHEIWPNINWNRLEKLLIVRNIFVDLMRHSLVIQFGAIYIMSKRFDVTKWHDGLGFVTTYGYD